MSNNVIRDVAYRTNGEMYIGVVGSVRSGKSLFIRKFMEKKVLPYVLNDSDKNKIIDDLPQSAEGKTIMTVEPKFIPANTVNIVIEEETKIGIRLVDCVGFVIPSSKGYINEDGSKRLVSTPWFSEDIPFEEAALVGTKKVIENHSHIGIVMTSDGSFSDFKRSEYEEIEEKVIEELKKYDKPFVIVLNTTSPNNKETKALALSMEAKYEVSVIAVNVNEITEKDIDNILNASLNEFNIGKLDIKVPSWISVLSKENKTKSDFDKAIEEATSEFKKFKHVSCIKDRLSENQAFSSVKITSIDASTGEVEITIDCEDNLYQQTINEIIGEDIADRGAFIAYLQEASKAKAEYANYQAALESVKTTGYGIAIPPISQMKLETPEIIKQSGRYGVKLKAIAPSIHMIKVDVESTFEPIIGSEEQSKSLIDSLMIGYEENPEVIWDSVIFGRKLSDVVSDGVKAKLYLVPENIQYKFKESLEKIVNKGKGGIIAFIL